MPKVYFPAKKGIRRDEEIIKEGPGLTFPFMGKCIIFVKELHKAD